VRIIKDRPGHGYDEIVWREAESNVYYYMIGPGSGHGNLA